MAATGGSDRDMDALTWSRRAFTRGGSTTSVPRCGMGEIWGEAPHFVADVSDAYGFRDLPGTLRAHCVIDYVQAWIVAQSFFGFGVGGLNSLIPYICDFVTSILGQGKLPCPATAWRGRGDVAWSFLGALGVGGLVFGYSFAHA